MKNDSALFEKLCCPRCGSHLSRNDATAIGCSNCSSAYEAVGVIDLLMDQSLFTALEDIDYDATAGGYNDKSIKAIWNSWNTVFQKVGLDLSGKSILEIGAGTGALTSGMLRFSECQSVFATDLSKKFLEKAIERGAGDERLVPVRCDCNAIPAFEEQFDVVVGRSILHHLLDYDKVLAQCARILKPGGVAVFFEPMLEGKLVVAMLTALIVDLERQERKFDLKSFGFGRKSDLTRKDLNKMEQLARHITKESWYPQTREKLAKLEDKYIFTLPMMREKGLEAGFAQAEAVHDNRPMDYSYWPQFIGTMRNIGVDGKKLQKYKFLSGSYARTFGAFPELNHAPMVHFCFRK